MKTDKGFSMKNKNKWRIASFAFIGVALLFVIFNKQIGYTFDALGISGKKAELDISGAPGPKAPLNKKSSAAPKTTCCSVSTGQPATDWPGQPATDWPGQQAMILG